MHRISAAVFVLTWLIAGAASAQDATVVGTVVDESGGVLPGVTVTATDLETGRQYVAVTAERGEYRLNAVPAGRYRIQAELPGFASVVVPRVELLVGQNATVPFTLKVATLEETVTVTSEAPLVDLRSSQVAGNVDRRQMEELPINGRNWMELSMLVKGITANAVGSRPGVSNDRDFQLNLDGQQITNQRCCSGGFGNPQLSREAIAEYQVVTNLFDITLGRSVGIQVQAITRSGTNNFDGSLYGYFRDDRFNAADPFTNAVLPYANQQVGGALGGPILRDKAHFFGSYEYEREPSTVVINPSALRGQTLTMESKLAINNVLGRGDYQLARNDHLTVRGLFYRRYNPRDALSTNNYPTLGSERVRESIGATGTWSRVIGSNRMQEVRFGYFRYHYANNVMKDVALTPEYVFPGLRVGPAWNYPNPAYAPVWNFGYNLAWHRGRHDLKIGGEYRDGTERQVWPARARGRMFFSARPADIDRRFPIDAWSDPSRWDLSGLDPLALRFDISFAEDYRNWAPRPTWAAWIGDTWQVRDRLTLNLGVRYDLAWGDLAPPAVRATDVIINNGLFTENVGFRNDIRDLNNVAPRVGFTWDVTGAKDFVIRGGSGLFYANVLTVHAIEQQLRNGQRVIEASFAYDGRPGWVQDPTRGVTAADVLSGRVVVASQNVAPIAHDYEMPYTWQTILGFQKQLTDVMAVDADLVYTRGHNEDTARDANVFYDPATGFPKHPARAGRPAASFGQIHLRESKGRSDYAALPMSFTRRYRDNFQASVTYTLMLFKNDSNSGDGGWGGYAANPFDRDAEWARTSDFQRHTFRVNGVWNLPWDFTLAGMFRYGSGNYSSLNSGVDPLGLGSLASSRVRPDLSVVPRNTFKDDPHQSLDLRMSKSVRLVGDVRLTGIAEIFNLYDYARYSYNLDERSPRLGERQASAGSPRSWQLAFKLSF